MARASVATLDSPQPTPTRMALVSRAEFVAVVPGGDAIFKSKDPNGDGFISEKEAYNNVKKAYDANGKEMPRGLFTDIPE